MNFRDDRPTLLEPQTRRAAFQGMRHPATRRRVAADPNIPTITPWESLAGATLLAAPAALGILISLYID
jgi:hypothetical protein